MATLPKRRKSKDNPYTIGYDEINEKYTIEFVNSNKIFCRVEISEQIYKAFNEFELEDISQLHKYERHIEHSEIHEETIYTRSIAKLPNIDSIIENEISLEKLKIAINSLSEVQKRRIKMFYFEDLTQKEIAQKEGTSIRAIQYSLNKAINNLKEILKKLNY